MKIRRELNRQLYRQKAYGFENKPSCFDKAVLDAILSGETKRLEQLVSSERLSLSAGMRTLTKNELRNEKYHFMIIAAISCRVRHRRWSQPRRGLYDHGYLQSKSGQSHCP